MFPQTPLLIQKAELDWAFADGKPAPFKKDRPIKELSGDFDIFGDGSVVILATPGHTPGHQSLLVQPEEDRLCRADRRLSRTSRTIGTTTACRR